MARSVVVCGLQEIGREFGDFSTSLASYRFALSPRRRFRFKVKVKVKVGAKLNRFRFALGRKIPSL